MGVTLILSFEVPGQPVAKARPRVTRRGTYTPKRTRDYERAVGEAALVAWAARRVTIAGPVAVEVEFTMKVAQKRLWGNFHPVRPDVDNLAKVLLDGLHAIMADDASVARLSATKRYGEHGSARVSIYGLEIREV